MEVGLGPGHIVLDGVVDILQRRGRGPHFLAHFYCDQTAGCIKIPVGMVAGLGPGHIVLDGTQPPPQKKNKRGVGTAPTIFGPCLLWPDGWMDH